MKDNKSKNIIIALLVVIIIILVALVVLFATDTISFNSSESDTNNTQLNDSNINDTETNNSSSDGQTTIDAITSDNNTQNNINSTVEKYIGTWYLENDDYKYTNINIERTSDSTTGYTIDIRVNKMADYNDLELYCYENTGVCYFSGDENHNFSLIMAYDQIDIIPDYATVGTIWSFTNKQ